MLDEVTVMHKGGLVLWSHRFSPIVGNPINQLIKTVLLADRVAETAFVHDNYKMQWLLDNKLDLVFVVVYQHLLALTYIEQLLQELRDSFYSHFADALNSRAFLADPGAVTGHTQDYADHFKGLLRKVESRAEAARDDRRRQRSASQKGRAEEDMPVAASGGDSAAADDDGPRRALSGRAAAIARMKEGKQTPAASSSKKPAGKKAAPKKVQRKWDDRGVPVDGSAPASGGYVEPEESAPQVVQTVDPTQNPTDIDGWEDSDDERAAPASQQPQKPAQRGRFSQWMRDRFGTREVDSGDLETLLPKLRESLTEKNVATEIAENLTSSVSAELAGKKLNNFTSLSATIKQAMEAALLRILTPKRNIDILRDVQKARAAGRPYIITFCGVNGVGKSTNLSKVAYWLKGQGLSVLIAACDTFRSGAVEQLEVHSRRIGVPVYQKGYAKDAADVASQAIQQARRDHVDVVLVDTAGRMQDNRPLMAALAKLIHTNKPDLVLFVGEALVGNDGVDQLRKFNQSLQDLTPVGQQQRGIDGILLTKFDTIDDKVGAAISMVHESGQPIVFVGVGQQYQDLRTLNPTVVVRSLLR
eukprot:TRINITY_DN7603_c0_g2_i1.p1 TRINITY_DN7603_c0_g2~~TRINITY_DN7603_c0_g2_i1.p1  ORF type:complete len:587 (+),score=216.07 TRINITY_DN7603_c0_g2_i1:96-1856(+)